MDLASQTTLTLGIAMRSPKRMYLDERLVTALTDCCAGVARIAGAPPPRSTSFNAIAMIGPLTPRALLTALDLCAQRDDIVCGAWVTPPSNPRQSGHRVITRARQSTIGFAIGPDPSGRERSAAVGAILSLHMAVAKARTRAQWAAIVAVAQHGTTVGAAQELGISHQAVSKAQRRANADATNGTWLALVELLRAERAEV